MSTAAPSPSSASVLTARLRAISTEPPGTGAAEAALILLGLALAEVQTLSPEETEAAKSDQVQAALAANARATGTRRHASSIQTTIRRLLAATSRAASRAAGPSGSLRLLGPADVDDLAARLEAEWGLDATRATTAAERMAAGCPEGLAVLPHAVQAPNGVWGAPKGPRRLENLEWLCLRWGVALNSRSGLPCRVTVDEHGQREVVQVSAADLTAARYAWAREHEILEPAGEVREVFEFVASRCEFDPVRDYLDALPAWDRVPRLPQWLVRYAGAGAGPEAKDTHLAELGTAWMISAVARVMEPGCKADGVLVLAGAMGAGKSELFKALFGREFHSEDKIIPGERDAIQVMRRAWLYELAELAVAKSTDMRDLRRWVSQEVETTRFAYGKVPETIPRRCIFAATVNPETNKRLVDDPAGKRRWWLVECQRPLDPAGVAAVRDQLWAEALHLYRSKVPHWISKSAELENERRHEAIDLRHLDHPWVDRLALHLEALATEGALPESMTTLDVLDLVGKPAGQQTERDLRTAGEALRTLGWLPYPPGHPLRSRPLRYWPPGTHRAP